jgi:glycosyltransferase involved in cell wall biosynthesis
MLKKTFMLAVALPMSSLAYVMGGRLARRDENGIVSAGVAAACVRRTAVEAQVSKRSEMFWSGAEGAEHESKAAIDRYLVLNLLTENVGLTDRMIESKIASSHDFLEWKKQELIWTLEGLGRRLNRECDRARRFWRNSPRQAAEAAAQAPQAPKIRLAQWAAELASAPQPELAPQRILVECTNSAISEAENGIGRSTRNLVKRAVATGSGMPILIYESWLAPLLSPGANPAFRIEPGDVLLVPELTEASALRRLIDLAERSGASIAIVVHDLIPIKHPGAVDLSHVQWFGAWIDEFLPRADCILTVSKSVALDVQRYFRNGGVRPKPGARLAWFHHGFELGRGGEKSPARIEQLCLEKSPFFLSVGTVEPRKGLSVALDAFETLWAKGKPYSYIIAGREGWLSQALASRIAAHAEFGKRLLWLRDATDVELRQLYAKAEALVFASFDEGFGFPLIEAAGCGTRVIASDIPVFREVASEEARYFKPLDAESLANQIERNCRRSPPSSGDDMLSSADAADMVFKLLRNDPFVRERWLPLA